MSQSLEACLGAHAPARYMVVCLCVQSVCACVCVDCYSCSRINEVQVRVSIGKLRGQLRLHLWFVWLPLVG